MRTQPPLLALKMEERGHGVARNAGSPKKLEKGRKGILP